MCSLFPGLEVLLRKKNEKTKWQLKAAEARTRTVGPNATLSDKQSKKELVFEIRFNGLKCKILTSFAKKLAVNCKTTT